MKRALITGITGQDGRHLSQFLADKDYEVFGLVRGQANPKIEMVQGENPALELIEGRKLPGVEALRMAEAFLAEHGHRAIAQADASEIDDEIVRAVFRAAMAWAKVHAELERKRAHT